MLLGGVLCTMYGRFLFYYTFFCLLMVKQIFLPSFREILFLLGLFVSSSKQNLHERKINGSLGKICVNILAFIVEKVYYTYSTNCYSHVCYHRLCIYNSSKLEYLLNLIFIWEKLYEALSKITVIGPGYSNIDCVILQT